MGGLTLLRYLHIWVHTTIKVRNDTTQTIQLQVYAQTLYFGYWMVVMVVYYYGCLVVQVVLLQMGQYLQALQLYR
jgi:hypothetical protein